MSPVLTGETATSGFLESNHAMDFFVLPLELRLTIYLELLVCPETIVFRVSRRRCEARRIGPKRCGLWPALLGANKKVHGETSPLLYSKNSFQFSVDSLPRSSAYSAPFFRQIGHQASYIRKISIPVSISYDPQSCRYGISEVSNNDLELIRDASTSLTALELSLLAFQNGFLAERSDHADEILGTQFAGEILKSLGKRIKAIPTLQQTVLIIVLCEDQVLNRDLMKEVLKCGWTVRTQHWFPVDDWDSDLIDYDYDSSDFDDAKPAECGSASVFNIPLRRSSKGTMDSGSSNIEGPRFPCQFESCASPGSLTIDDFK